MTKKRVKKQTATNKSKGGRIDVKKASINGKLFIKLSKHSYPVVKINMTTLFTRNG